MALCNFDDMLQISADQRNDLYITLREAKFSKGSKKAERNLLVQVSVRDAKGNEVKGAISRGTGTF